MSIELTSAILKKCFPLARQSKIDTFLPLLQEHLPKHGIDTNEELAAFLANVAVECAQLNTLSENLNYSAAGLASTFHKYFPTRDLQEEYARKPDRIASRAYANRMGNGDEESGEGWKYRGRGLLQLTGRDNYARCAAGVDYDVLEDPDWVATPEGAVLSACWYWQSKRLDAKADTNAEQDVANAGDFKGVIQGINGGQIGAGERKHFYELACDALGVEIA